MRNPTHIPVVTVRSLSPSKTLGARFSVTFPYTGRSKVIPYDHAYSSACENAVAWLNEKNLLPIGVASLGKGVSVLTFGIEDHSALWDLFCR